MELSAIVDGFAVSLQPINLLACFVGVFVGTLIGVLPGIDDHALLSRAGCHHVAVGGECSGREPGDEHGPSSLEKRKDPTGAAGTGYRAISNATNR